MFVVKYYAATMYHDITDTVLIIDKYLPCVIYRWPFCHILSKIANYYIQHKMLYTNITHKPYIPYPAKSSEVYV